MDKTVKLSDGSRVINRVFYLDKYFHKDLIFSLFLKGYNVTHFDNGFVRVEKEILLKC